MRLFTAIELPPYLLLRLERLLSALRPEAQINWSPLDNLHITTKFIGEWPEDRLPELKATLTTLVPCDPFRVELKGLGWFPNAHSPRVLWVGLEGEESLKNLAQKTEECLTPLGIPKESRVYSPHLTLARIKRPVPLGRLRQAVEGMQPAALGEFTTSSFSLYRSDPGSNASVYRKVQEFPFESARAAS